MPVEKYYDPDIETINRMALEKLQLERLQQQVSRCYEKSDFYRERLDKSGVKPDDVKSLNDIVRIPVVTKEELRAEQENYPPWGRFIVADQSEWAELHPSTGTTGRPVNTIWSKKDVKKITDFTARLMYGFGVRRTDSIQNGFSYGLWVAGIAVHYASQKLGAFTIPIGATLTDRHIDYLLNAGSTVLFATPSFALYIAERLKSKGYDPDDTSLRIGSFGGEGGTENEATRNKLERRLGIDAYDIFGLAEIGPTMSAECTAKDGLHWTEDHHLIEVINPDTMEPCEEGEMGILTITHLTREATPMLRYWTNDYARLSKEPCQCGRTHARSPGGIMGRADDMVIYRGAKFYPVQVEKVVRAFEYCSDEFKILLDQDQESKLETCIIQVEIESSVEKNEAEKQLKQALKEELLVTPKLELLEVGTLERTTFKAKRIKDKR